jgi:hypothetical protein
MKDAMKASKERPLIFALFLTGAPPYSKKTKNTNFDMDVQFSQVRAGIKEELFELVPSMKALADANAAPILIRFEIEFTDGKKEHGVLTHSL